VWSEAQLQQAREVLVARLAAAAQQRSSSSAAAQQQQRSSSSFTCSAEAEWGSRHPQGLAEVLFAVGLSVNQLLAIAAGVSQMLWLTDATCGPQHHAMH
jgi:hypothetical protein